MDWERRDELITEALGIAPGESRRIVMDGFGYEPCVLCGEMTSERDVAEMHDGAMFDGDLTEEERIVAQERTPNNGIVHPQCGIDAGWVQS